MHRAPSCVSVSAQSRTMGVAGVSACRPGASRHVPCLSFKRHLCGPFFCASLEVRRPPRITRAIAARTRQSTRDRRPHTSVLDACVRAAGRSWWGKADLAGGRVQGAGGELSRTHVCQCIPSYLIRASPRRCIVWLPRLNRSATVGSSTCTLTKCGYLSVVDVACEIQYRRPSDSNLRG